MADRVRNLKAEQGLRLIKQAIDIEYPDDAEGEDADFRWGIGDEFYMAIRTAVDAALPDRRPLVADRVLRDHSEPCKDLGRFKEANGVWGCDEYGCPGGQEVTIDQIGWFNPGSKRFCYTDEKEVHPQHHTSYTKSVFVADLREV